MITSNWVFTYVTNEPRIETAHPIEHHEFSSMEDLKYELSVRLAQEIKENREKCLAIFIDVDTEVDGDFGEFLEVSWCVNR